MPRSRSMKVVLLAAVILGSSLLAFWLVGDPVWSWVITMPLAWWVGWTWNDE